MGSNAVPSLANAWFAAPQMGQNKSLPHVIFPLHPLARCDLMPLGNTPNAEQEMKVSQSTTNKTARKAKIETENKEVEMSQSNGADTALEPITVNITWNDNTLPVALDRKYGKLVGQPITQYAADLLDAMISRQFKNNQSANALARATKFAAATTSEDRTKNAPLSETDYQSLWTDYAGPDVDLGGGRAGSGEKQRDTAAWNAWVQILADHTAMVAAGDFVLDDKGQPTGTTLFLSTKPMSVTPKPRKEKNSSAESHAVSLAAWEAARANIITKVLAAPRFAHYVTAEMDKLKAAAGKGKAADATVVVEATAQADLI
jgi:hypothetical protein